MKYLLLFSVLLSGCATSHFAYRNNGMDYYEARCDGSVLSISDCYNEASKRCNGSFITGASSENSTLAFAGGQIFNGKDRSLIFACK